ncbi:MAG TPA: hypothetical protein VKD72_12200, partial [Gemmataceae bacterium]|nr:hypothetical protein [Gemmataceae bacterium]
MELRRSPPPLDQSIGHRLSLLKELEDDERTGPVACPAVVIFVNLQLVEGLSGAGEVVTSARVPAPRLIVDLMLNWHPLCTYDGEHGVPRAVIGSADEGRDRGLTERDGRREPAAGNRDGGPFADLGDRIEQFTPLLRLGLTFGGHGDHSAAVTWVEEGSIYEPLARFSRLTSQNSLVKLVPIVGSSERGDRPHGSRRVTA